MFAINGLWKHKRHDRAKMFAWRSPSRLRVRGPSRPLVLHVAKSDYIRVNSTQPYFFTRITARKPREHERPIADTNASETPYANLKPRTGEHLPDTLCRSRTPNVAHGCPKNHASGILAITRCAVDPIAYTRLPCSLPWASFFTGSILL